jgi:hypothetical protein
MPARPVPAHVSRQAWGPHAFSRPPRRRICPQCTLHRRTLTSWRRKLETLRAVRAKQAQLGEAYWRAAPSFLSKQRPKFTQYQLEQLRAELRRWNGRRSMFLGGYRTTRRDAAFVAHEAERPLFAEEKKNPLLQLFRERARAKTDDIPGCAPVQAYGHRRLGVGKTFEMDADFHQVCLFCILFPVDVISKCGRLRLL